MSHNKRSAMPARTSPGQTQTRSALPVQCPGGSEKLARGAELRVRIGTANVGTMTGKRIEVVEMANRRRLDFCCLQETRWRGNGTENITLEDPTTLEYVCRYKLFWKGCEGGTAGVGVLVGESWIDKVLEVKRISERIMVLRVIVGKSVLNLVSVYAPQVGLQMEKKEEFLISLRKVLSAVAADERLLVCGDLNGHVGAGVDGFEGVHGGYGYGTRNVEGEMLLEFADAMDLAVANTWFKKAEQKLVTFESVTGNGECKTVLDYILVRQKERKLLKDVKVIPGEPILKQHKLLVCILQLGELGCKRKKELFVSKCKVWKLREPEIQQAFEAKVRTEWENKVVDNGDVEVMWGGLKKCLLDAADEICGKTRGKQRHNETWWWNAEIAELLKEKRRLFKLYYQSKRQSKGRSRKDMRVYEAGVIAAKKKYDEGKRAAKRAISKAQEVERRKFGERLDEEDEKGTVFRVAKQIVRNNRDVVGAGCVKDTDGRIVIDEEKMMEVWRAHYEKLSNEEFPWDKEALTGAESTSGPCEEITIAEVEAAIKKMKRSKAAGPSGVVADMLKAAGDAGTIWVTELCNAVVREGRIPEDWCKSWMVNVYKGKGDALECGSYRGIRLLEHVMKILERVVEVRVRKIVRIDDMQFGFMAGKGTTDAIFVVRQLQEKYLAKKKDLWMAFVDLEKAFDRVPREVVWWALRSLGVDEWLVSVIQAMYADTSTMVKLNGKVSKGFNVKVGVHQGSVLSPLLFIIVLEALSRKFRGGLPMELLYADDLVILADSEELLIEKLKKWKAGMEEKGLRVNMGKTKIMRCQVGAGQVAKLGKYPCGVCSKGVGSNSIQCTSCKAWVHKKCSGIRGKLNLVSDFRCRKCIGGNSRTGRSDVVQQLSLGVGQSLECVDKFCYLGDMIGAGGGAEEASRARVRCAWAKFKELAPILTCRGPSLKVKGKVYKACVQRVLVYGSETWPVKTDVMHSLERTERMMVRWMCGVSLKNRVASEELNRRLDVEGVADVVRRGRLRWFGHLERKAKGDCVSACRDFVVDGPRGKGRSKKTWRECVDHDMRSLDLRAESAQHRTEWRGLIGRNRPTRARMEKRTLNR